VQNGISTPIFSVGFGDEENDGGENLRQSYDTKGKHPSVQSSQAEMVLDDLPLLTIQSGNRQKGRQAFPLGAKRKDSKGREGVQEGAQRVMKGLGRTGAFSKGSFERLMEGRPPVICDSGGLQRGKQDSRRGPMGWCYGRKLHEQSRK